MKKFLVLFILFITSCGYQPLYKSNNEINNFKIKEIEFLGDREISRKIYSSLPFMLSKNDKTLNKIIINSNKSTIEASKNSKGQATSYRTTLTLSFQVINNNNELTEEKFFKKEFSYNADENKFKFKEYQKKIEENLIKDMSQDLIFYLNYS